MNVLNIIQEPLVSIGIHNILQDHFTNAEVVSTFELEEIERQIETNTFDVIILDIGISSINMHELMKTLKSQQESAKVLILSGSEYKNFAMKYINMGASGFLDKASSQEDLVLAIKLIKSGNLYLSKDMLMSIYNTNVGHENDFTPFNKLSKRELEVFKLMIKGKRIKDISKIMKIHQSTTSTLKKRVMAKFNVDNLMKLKTMAMEYGY